MNSKQKISIAKISASALLFIIGTITNVFWFYIIAYLIAGYSTIRDALHGIINKQFLDENFLMTIASVGAIYAGEYPEAVAVMLFYQIGSFFETYAVNNSRKSISTLMNIEPEYANKIIDGEIAVVDPDELVIGDNILIKPGEKIPVDGVIIDGSSSIDTQALTGESIPSNVSEKDFVISGTINLSGLLTVEVTKEYEDSTVAKVLDLVENAASKKANVEKFITKFAKYYTPIVVSLAIALAIIPPLVINGATFKEYIYNAMIFLVISCPCALVISVPLSLFAGVGSASKRGILVKGSNYLEALASVDTIAFDKTGTLTTGKFSVSEVTPISSNINKTGLLALAVSIESFSNHPIAKAIVSKGKDENIKFNSSEVTNFTELPGLGLKATILGENFYCGNEKLLSSLNLSSNNAGNSCLGSIVYISSEKEFLGYICVTDTIRANTKETLTKLKSLGINKTIMLTGDREEIATTIGKSISIDGIYSQLLPGDKVNIIEEILTEDKKGHTAFIGDGINDAPVLSRADVGVAMGAFGSDAAIEAADIVIMKDDISKLVDVISIAKKTLKIAKQNIIFALSVKVLILILGAFGIASMWAAVFADVGVAFIAILNSMRALKF